MIGKRIFDGYGEEREKIPVLAPVTTTTQWPSAVSHRMSGVGTVSSAPYFKSAYNSTLTASVVEGYLIEATNTNTSAMTVDKIMASNETNS